MHGIRSMVLSIVRDVSARQPRCRDARMADGTLQELAQRHKNLLKAVETPDALPLRIDFALVR